MLNFRPKFQ